MAMIGFLPAVAVAAVVVVGGGGGVFAGVGSDCWSTKAATAFAVAVVATAVCSTLGMHFTAFGVFRQAPIIYSLYCRAFVAETLKVLLHGSEVLACLGHEP